MQYILPQDNELVVSIFGKSSFYGECILIHLGNQEWLVKDSFHVKENGQNIPIAEKYLHQLYGESWNTRIKYIVISHWHDDHIHGISKLVSNAVNLSYLFVSVAMSPSTLLDLVQADSEINGKYSRTKEVKRISDWRKNNKKKFVTINSFSTHEAHSKSIKFISPTISIVNKSNDAIANTIRILKNIDIPKIVSPNENSASVGIKLDCKKTGESILLGADIEDAWDEIIEQIKINDSFIKSIIYKVAHHGSENGFDIRVWEELLVSDPFSIITCWKKGKLPKKEFALRIQELSRETYITANNFEEPGLNKLQSLAPYGHIRCNYLEDEKKWEIATFGTASNLSDALSPN